jgi:chromosome segregation ATPase
MNLVNKTMKGINRLKRERDEWIKKYEDIVNSYKSMIEKAQSNAEKALTIVQDDKKEHEDLKSDIEELKRALKDFFAEYQKKLHFIEKVENDLVEAKKEKGVLTDD